MAWVYELSIECGTSAEAADQLARHFGDWPSARQQDSAGNRWCLIVPGGLSRGGVTSAADAVAMTAVGEGLYEMLRAAPPVYRFALAGVETEEFRTFGELLDEPDVGDFAGLVLSDEVWAATGRPADFEPFAPGYRWIPYPGEVYESS